MGQEDYIIRLFGFRIASMSGPAARNGRRDEVNTAPNIYRGGLDSWKSTEKPKTSGVPPLVPYPHLGSHRPRRGRGATRMPRESQASDAVHVSQCQPLPFQVWDVMGGGAGY